ncbi:MAG: pyridoxamine 5'-phosphate oxidase family protein [Lachnospiraceae bacterium]|nr:pyridoxamine 5'-phosphate oxidase family protein [Lachnospiraceae bacterium]
MFRPMRRRNQALTPEECAALLIAETRGVLSLLGDDDYPYGVPVNHWYDPETGRLYFHGGKAGHRVDAAARHDKVSFCVFDKGTPEEGSWALRVNCVVIFGRIRPVTDPEETIRISRALSHKFTKDEAYIEAEVARSGANTLAYEIVIEHMTGKRIKES